MPAFIKPLSYESWSDVPMLAEYVNSDKWKDSLREALSILLIAIKEYHYNVINGSSSDFPDQYPTDHMFWAWFDNIWRVRLLDIMEEIPETFDPRLGWLICVTAKQEGIEFGSRL